MIRESLISAYLFLFQSLFILCKLFPQKEKIVFAVSFSDNTKYLADAFQKEQVKAELVFLCKGNCVADFREEKGKSIPLETPNPAALLRAAYHLATSKLVFVDNYFGFLSVVKFRRGVECIQIWHAAGALKKFGLEDQSVRLRTKRANRRFMSVYQHFDKVITGSDIMAEIFKRSFGITEERILRTGIPRTDFFYQRAGTDSAVPVKRREDDQDKRVKKVLPFLEGALADKKKILYAPTYRDGELSAEKIHLDLDLMREALSRDYVLLLRLHPAVHKDFEICGQDKTFAFDCSSCRDVNELLLVSDILVTDYSSLPVEYALLKKPMIFYPYDLDDYGRERGFQTEYMDWIPGPVAFTTQEVIHLITQNDFDLNAIASFSSLWNRYSKGCSSRNVVRYAIKSCGLLQ